MSYPRDLDEYQEHELEAEIMRRRKARAEGVCDYCLRSPEASSCMYPKRHYAGGACVVEAVASNREVEAAMEERCLATGSIAELRHP